MSLLIVAAMLSPAVIGIVVLVIVMARRERAADRTSATRRVSPEHGYSQEDVLRSQANTAQLRFTGCCKGPLP